MGIIVRHPPSKAFCLWIASTDSCTGSVFSCSQTTDTCLWNSRNSVVGCGNTAVIPHFTACADFNSTSCDSACSANANILKWYVWRLTKLRLRNPIEKRCSAADRFSVAFWMSTATLSNSQIATRCQHAAFQQICQWRLTLPMEDSPHRFSFRGIWDQIISSLLRHKSQMGGTQNLPVVR